MHYDADPVPHPHTFPPLSDPPCVIRANVWCLLRLLTVWQCPPPSSLPLSVALTMRGYVGPCRLGRLRAAQQLRGFIRTRSCMGVRLVMRLAILVHATHLTVACHDYYTHHRLPWLQGALDKTRAFAITAGPTCARACSQRLGLARATGGLGLGLGLGLGSGLGYGRTSTGR